MTTDSTLSASRRLRWAILGLVVGFAASTIVGGIVLTAGDYELDVVSGHGSDVGRAAMQLVSGDGYDDPRVPIRLIALLQVPLWVGLLGAPLMARREGMSWRNQLRWSMKPVDVPVGLAVGLATQLVLVPLLYAPIFWLFGDQDVEEAARSLVGRADGSLDVIALVLLTVIGAPIIEEIFFRGLLHGALTDRYSRPVALASSSLIFGASHLQLLQFPALVLVGVVHAVLMDRTGRIAPAIFSHVAFNAVTVFVLLGD